MSPDFTSSAMHIILIISTAVALHRPIVTQQPLLLLSRRVSHPVAVMNPPEKPEKPNMPPTTEEGGPLSMVLPLQLLRESQVADRSKDSMVGEDAGTFTWANEKWGDAFGVDWLQFCVAVGSILTALVVLWIYPATGYSDDFLAGIEGVCGGNSHLVTLAFGILFPIVHSGLASLRPYATPYTGERLWRVIFAWPSLCLSYSWITYYIAHAHDGLVFWNGEASVAAHTIAWTVNFASFFFLYPTVFNLKEVAAVEKPKIHLWETGIIRITRHPQMVGQVMWSSAHLAMVGSTFNALTMALLVGHHVFACWNGDRRLLDEHGDNFIIVKERTSVVPFAAIAEGRQQLPPDYWRELVRAPYALIALGTLGAYQAHPYMRMGADLVKTTGVVEGGILDGLGL